MKYPIEHVLGGKNVYYFLTRLDRGRFQTLPLAYDVKWREWFDMAASGVRHYPHQSGGDAPVDWKDRVYTFNTGCYGCHVSRLSTHYDPGADSYRTTWDEPGIDCETCHGPGAEHARVCRRAPEGTVPDDLKIIRGGSRFTPRQNNDACASCHAKAAPLTGRYRPDGNFYDFFDLTTLEHPDFYPDGRDLGENYTLTTWLLSPCVKSGRLDCLHCHTSSGRFKQKQDPNQACLPCHRERVDNAADHAHHPPSSEGGQCIACHMPATEFARMKRSDHSMLPPAPSATLAFKSPNACNLCHSERDAQWADALVRRWRTRDYQAPLLHRAGLIDAARRRDWSRLPEMLAYIASNDRDEVFAASLIRLLPAASDPRIRPVLLSALQDPAPLVRAAAAEAVSLRSWPQGLQALAAAAGDKTRLVRIRAAAGLAAAPRDRLTTMKSGMAIPPPRRDGPSEPVAKCFRGRSERAVRSRPAEPSKRNLGSTNPYSG